MAHIIPPLLCQGILDCGLCFLFLFVLRVQQYIVAFWFSDHELCLQ